MERLVNAPMREFRVVCEAARQRERFFAEALYPPRCKRRTGRLTFRTVGDGSTELGVELTAYDGHVDSVRSLFESQSLLFDGAAAVHDFCHGPLAEAFAEEPGGWPEPPRHIDTQALTRSLDATVGDQPEAAERLAQLVSAGLARTNPSQPISVALVGSRGLGKASMARALPLVLESSDCPGHRLFEIDSSTLASETRAGAILGFPHVPRDQANEPPLVATLRHPRPIILVRGIERANPLVMLNVVAPLIEDGGVIAPDGSRVRQPAAVVILTTAYGADGLTDGLEGIPPVEWRARERLCRAHLRESEFLTDIADAVSAVVPFVPLGPDAQIRAAKRCIRAVGAEYDVVVDKVDRVLSTSVVELAAEPVNLRSLLHAARDVLGNVFASSRALFDGAVELEAGPPPRLRAASEEGSAP
jgi:hypothetical protein